MIRLLLLLLIGLLINPLADAKEIRILKSGKNPNQLHDELLVAFPVWKGTLQPDGTFHNPGLLRVEHTSTEIIVTVPDDADPVKIQTVINAHVPKPPLPDFQAELEAAIASVDTSGILDPSTKAAIDKLKNALTGKVKRGKVEAMRP